MAPSNGFFTVCTNCTVIFTHISSKLLIIFGCIYIQNKLSSKVLDASVCNVFLSSTIYTTSCHNIDNSSVQFVFFYTKSDIFCRHKLRFAASLYKLIGYKQRPQELSKQWLLIGVTSNNWYSKYII